MHSDTAGTAGNKNKQGDNLAFVSFMRAVLSPL